MDSELPLGYPGRSIVSGCGSLIENVSAYTDIELNPYMESLRSYVKDTSDFITTIHNLKIILENASLVTLDVTSLYSNIPHDAGIIACAHFTSEGVNSQEVRSLILKLINLVLAKIIFCLMVSISSKFSALPWVPILPPYSWIFLTPVIKHLWFGCDSLLTLL